MHKRLPLMSLIALVCLRGGCSDEAPSVQDQVDGEIFRLRAAGRPASPNDWAALCVPLDESSAAAVLLQAASSVRYAHEEDEESDILFELTCGLKPAGEEVTLLLSSILASFVPTLLLVFLNSGRLATGQPPPSYSKHPQMRG